MTARRDGNIVVIQPVRMQMMPFPMTTPAAAKRKSLVEIELAGRTMSKAERAGPRFDLSQELRFQLDASARGDGSMA